MKQENRANKSPYQIIKQRYITEKATLLSQLKDKESNKSLKRCSQAKYVFLVERNATKCEIRAAVEEIYAERNIKVKSVNTILQKPKYFARRGNRKAGRTTYQKKAIVTLDRGDTLED